MNTDMADLLRDGIARLTEGERIPPGLADRAARHNQQRRIALRTVTTTGTAVVAAVAVFAAIAATGGPLRHSSGTVRPQTTAYVLSRTENALAAVGRKNLVQEVHTVGHNAPFLLHGNVVGVPATCTHHGKNLTCRGQPEPPVASAPQAVSWSYRGQFRETGLSAAGRPVFSASATYARAEQRSAAIGTAVDYANKTWWRDRTRQSLGFDRPEKECKYAALPPPVGVSENWRAEVRKALSCGHYRVAGHERIDGVNTIKIVQVSSPPYFLPTSVAFWVDSSNYLPVRASWTFALDDGHGDYGTLVGDFRWLAPTKANRAALHVAIPAGFRRVPSSGLPIIAFADVTW